MNPDNYGSLPACQKLAEVLAKKGIVPKTDAWWRTYAGHDGREVAELVDHGRKRNDLPTTNYYPAYSMAEVWRELPWYLSKYGTLEVTQVAETFACGYHKGLALREPVFTSDNPADALIDLLIWVLEQKE